MPDQKEPSGHTMTKRYEGFRDTVYKDTKGKNTIGYGFNIDDLSVSPHVHADVKTGKRKMTQAEADTVFPKLYERAAKDARNFIGAKAYDKLSEGQKNVITDMSYNMGGPKLSGFKEMKAAVLKGDFDSASKEIINSNYYKQTGNRAKNHVEQIKH